MAQVFESRIVGHDSVDPGVLKANQINWRTHPKNQRDAMQDLLGEVGWVTGIIVNQRTGAILDGHMRVDLAIRNEATTVPITYVDLSEEEEALILATYDPITDMARIDKANLAAVLERAKVTNSDALSKLAEATAKKAGLFLDEKEKRREAARVAADEAREALIAHYGVAQGQLWGIGTHRLICGDSTKPETYARLLGVERAACLFTDPPYGVDYEADSGKFAAIANDELKYDDLLAFLTAALRPAVKALHQQGAAYIWHASSTREDFAAAMKAVGLEERQYLIWAKPAPVLGWGDYQWGHEPCFYACHAGESPLYYGPRDQQTVWRIAGLLSDGNLGTTAAGGLLVTDGDGHQLFITDKLPKGKKPRHVRLDDQALVLSDAETDLWEVARVTNAAHPTEKPSALAERALENSTQPGDIVLDPFGGSGSTLVGAEYTDRRARLIELMPAYVAVILARGEELGLDIERLD